MKFPVLILALGTLAVPACGLCDEIGGTPPEQWLECFAATKIHQDTLAGSGHASMAVILNAGDPRIKYQRLARHWLTGFKKMKTDDAAGEMVKAPAEMKKNKSLGDIEVLARQCTVNLPNLADPMFYQKYPFLGAPDSD